MHHQHGGIERHEREQYFGYLQQFDRVFEPMHRDMIDWLNITGSTRILGVGCGAGGVTRLLAEAGRADSYITALDVESDFLAAAKKLLKDMPYAITYQAGSLDELPFAEGQFELIWCSRVVHHMRDQLAAVRELRRVLKPGGRLVLREDGLLMQLLPFDIGLGEPGLDERLNAVRAWEFAQLRPTIPDSTEYPFGWTRLLRDADFTHVTARSFLFEALSPFNADLSEFLLRHWRRFLEDLEIRARLSPDDQNILVQLMDADSPYFLLGRNDLYFVKVSTVYVGQI
jgi:SAM-dependent methyltransferase